MLTLFDNLPDSVMNLKKNCSGEKRTNETLKLLEQIGTHDIKVGNVDAAHYDLLYCNDRTDKIFSVKLSGMEPGNETLEKS